ncbi:hypothetical protein [Sphingomonas dokdonensis]|nr:hypothetical protein [Sphingomonas dokdonensis]
MMLAGLAPVPANDAACGPRARADPEMPMSTPQPNAQSVPLSRAINIAADENDVIATCAKRNVPISAIETLHSGGTRVVMNNITDTQIIAKVYGRKVITSAVKRTPSRLMRG